MKKLLTSVTALVLITGNALAADLPSRKAAPLLPPPPPPPMWTGFYAGLNAGYGFGTNGDFSSQNIAFASENARVGQVTDTGPTAMSGSRGLSQNGFLGGAQIGYNYQWGTNIVLGIEADIQGSGVRGSSQVIGAANSTTTLLGLSYDQSGVGSTTVDAGLDYLGTVRGRVGYLIRPNMLIYGTGGFAYGEAYSHVTQTAFSQTNLLANGAVLFSGTNMFFGTARQNQMMTGWTAGGGFEWMFMPNWSLKAEALYWDLGSMHVQSFPSGVTAAPGAPSTVLSGAGVTRVNYSGVAARAGLNYHFTW